MNFLTFKEQQQLELPFLSKLVWSAFLVQRLVCLQVATQKDPKRPTTTLNDPKRPNTTQKDPPRPTVIPNARKKTIPEPKSLTTSPILCFCWFSIFQKDEHQNDEYIKIIEKKVGTFKYLWKK